MKKIFAFLVAFASISFAQTTPSIANNQSSPVRIVSSSATPRDMMSELTVTNTTGHAVSNISVGLIVAIPGECSTHSFLSKERIHSFDVTLSPNESTTISHLHLSTEGIQRLLTRLHASDVMSQIAIVGVTYDDGTKWHLTRSSKVYDQKMLAFNIHARCGFSTGRIALADGVPVCSADRLTRVKQGYNGQYYTCVTGVDQICSVSATNTASCTNTACPLSSGCPNQQCHLNQATGGGGGSSGDSGTGCDPSYYWCDADDGSGDGGDDAGVDD